MEVWMQCANWTIVSNNDRSTLVAIRKKVPMRDAIIDLLKQHLSPYPFIHALWLEGADAHHRADQYSDMDIWIDADDTQVADAFDALEDTLKKLGAIDKRVVQNHDSEEIHQRFYHLEGTSPFLLLDVCIQKHSRNITLNENNTDERVVILFDKDNVLQFTNAISDTESVQTKERIREINDAFAIFRPKVEKHIKRGHFLSALHAYHQYVLEPLVALMRLQADPTKKDFYLKHIEQDLPASDVQMLSALFTVSTLEELAQKLDEAERILLGRIKKLPQLPQ